MSDPKVILIFKNRAMGDAIMGLSAVQYAAKLFPKSTILYGVPQWTYPLFRHTKNPMFSNIKIVPINFKSVHGLLDFYQLLLNEKVEWVHELFQSGRGKKIMSIVPLLFGVRYTAHNHHEKHFTGIKDQGKIKPNLQRDIDGVYSNAKIYLPELSYDENQYRISVPRLECTKHHSSQSSSRPIRIILGVVATRKTKQWPLRYFVTLMNMLNEESKNILHPYPYPFEFVIPLSKSRDDTNLKEELETFSLPHNCQIVYWPLENLVTEFQYARMYIGNDTGIKHLSVALGIPTMTIFGAEPPLEWHPYDERIHPILHIPDLSCRTRTHHYCGLSQCDLVGESYNQCLQGIHPEKVLNFIKNSIVLK